MDGFQKIDVNSSDKPSIFSKFKPKLKFLRFPRSGGKGKKASFVALVILIILGVGIAIPGLAVLGTVANTKSQAKAALSALKSQDIVKAKDELKKTRTALTQTQIAYKPLLIYKLVPFIGNYIDDGDHLISAGFYALDAADVFINSVEPYADVLGLKGKGSFPGSTQQRIETAMKTIGKVTPRIDDIAEKLNLGKKEIDNINPNDYPRFLAGGKLHSQLVSLRSLADSGASAINDAKPLIKILPELLGEPNAKRYLVLFQNDKERRPTGGFLTAYSIFRVEHGIIHVEESNNIYTLDDTIGGKKPAPRPIKNYLPNVSVFNIRDSNLSPDFVKSMETFFDMYKKSSGPKVDGVIAVDTQALVGAMQILGQVTADGVAFNTNTDPRCDCPQVIYKLEEIASTPIQADFRYVNVYAVNAARKNIIGDLMNEIMNKAFTSKPTQYWGPLFQEMINQISQKHVFFYVFDKEAQKGLDALNIAGRIVPFDGDYLHINEANFGGQKSNLFTTEDVSQDYKVESDGRIIKTLTINYKNPFPPSDCNLERGNLCLNAVLRNWIRIYAPQGSKMIDSKGSEVKITTYDELGKTVFEGFLTVRPKGVAKFTISYELPFKLEKGSSLPFLIQKQGGDPAYNYQIFVNGQKKEEFTLSTDKTFKLDL